MSIPGIIAFVMFFGVLLGKTYLNKYGVISISLIIFDLIQVGIVWLCVFLLWLAMFIWKEKNIHILIKKNMIGLYNKLIIFFTGLAGIILLYGLLAGLIWANSTIYISGIEQLSEKIYHESARVDLYYYYHQLSDNTLPYIFALPITAFSLVMLGWSIFMVLFITKWIRWMWSVFKMDNKIEK